MKLKKQFKDFYDEICIHEESEGLKEKRDILQKDIKDKFPGCRLSLETVTCAIFDGHA